MTAAGPIDCDLHPTVPNLAALFPYLDDVWRENAVRRGFEPLVPISYPTRNPLSVRADWRDADGRGASEPGRLGREALDPFGTSVGILNCLYGAPVMFSDDLAAAFCRAVNDWLAAQWLGVDPRLRASIVVPQLNPERAVDEIERRAGDPRFVQILLLVAGEAPLGRRQNWPIFAAAERHRLPVGIHAGSLYRHPVTPVGWPSTHVEDYVNQASAFASTLTSLIAEGVFAKFPDLRIVLMESGVSWLPAHLWRLTKFWKGLRSEVPWVSDPPTAIVRERVRLTVQPLDAPEDAELLARLIEHLDSDEMVLFSTDYPHWQFEGTAALPPGLDAGLARKIKIENPLLTYSRLKETVA